MFTTIEEVDELTGDDVDQEIIVMAQAIIESYIGRVEAEITNANDLMLLGRATAYQAVYLKGDYNVVFHQIKAQQIMQYGNMITFTDDGASPFIAPLAVIACKRLSWNKMRSVRTGGIFSGPHRPVSTWSTE